MGAAVAAGVVIAAPLIRNTLNRVGRPDFLLGIAEDAVAVHFGQEATGMSFERISSEAREAFDEVGERVKPALQKVGVPV